MGRGAARGATRETMGAGGTSTAEAWLPGIEALRGIAALSVVLHHSWSLSTMPRFSGYWIVEGFGSWGVDLFFLLSGYLLSAYFWKPKGQRSLRAFYSRRLFRILPAYYVNVGVLFLFFASHSNLFSRAGLEQVVGNATFTFWLRPETSSSLNVNGVLWTLSIEMTLYAFMPLLAWAVARRPAIAFSALVAAGLGWRVLAARTNWLSRFYFRDGFADEGNARLYIGRQFFGLLAIFMLGIGLRWLVHTGRLSRIMRPAAKCSVPVLLLLLVPSVAWLHWVERGNDFRHWIWFTGFDLVVAVLAVPALLYAARPVAGGTRWGLRLAEWLGERSYSIYLWHFPIVLSVYGRGPLLNPPDVSSIGLKLGLILALAVAVGSVSYELVEVPGRQFGRRLARRWTGGREAASRSENLERVEMLAARD